MIARPWAARASDISGYVRTRAVRNLGTTGPGHVVLPQTAKRRSANGSGGGSGSGMGPSAPPASSGDWRGTTTLAAAGVAPEMNGQNPASRKATTIDLKARIGTASFAFRGLRRGEPRAQPRTARTPGLRAGRPAVPRRGVGHQRRGPGRPFDLAARVGPARSRAWILRPGRRH